MADLQQHKTSAKYLTHYAEPEVLSLANISKRKRLSTRHCYTRISRINTIY